MTTDAASRLGPSRSRRRGRQRQELSTHTHGHDREAELIATGQAYWIPITNAPLEVRMTVSDTAGNVGEARLGLAAPGPASSGNAYQPPPPSAGNQPPAQPTMLRPGPRWIRAYPLRRLSLPVCRCCRRRPRSRRLHRRTAPGPDRC